jgi:hypothetical protein
VRSVRLTFKEGSAASIVHSDYVEDFNEVSYNKYRVRTTKGIDSLLVEVADSVWRYVTPGAHKTRLSVGTTAVFPRHMTRQMTVSSAEAALL